MITPFVSAEWLAEHASEVVLADVRWYADGRSPQAAYDEGHLPGAVYVDLDTVLAGPASDAAGRHPLPAPERFAAAMAALGVADDDLVVAYDDAGGVIAARLVWMLRATGHDAALLDGGLAGWVAACPEPLQTATPERAAARFTARPWPAQLLAGIDEAADPGEAVLLDARPRERYLGAPDSLDPRAGHIPGARSLPCRENLDSAGRLLPVDELRRRFAEVGVTGATEVISSCGSGVTACHTLLALEHVGFGAGRLFPGSWSQWSRDPSRPITDGQAPRGTP